jgi:hypothetical protein
MVSLSLVVADMVNDEGKQVSLYSIQPSRFQFEFNPIAAANGGVFGQLSLVVPAALRVHFQHELSPRRIVLTAI